VTAAAPSSTTPDHATRPESDPPERPPALVRLAELMNRGPAKALWSGYQRQVGARVFWYALSRSLRLHGLRELDAVDRGRPLLIVANHRSMLDLFVVATVLAHEAPGPWRFFFPVRGRYCYNSARGALLNATVAGWAMYPPFFREPGTQALDRQMLDRLVALAGDGAWHVIGFHPEGTRSRDSDPYTLLPPHPGVGQVVLAARPQIIPVFIAGLGNQLGEVWRGGRRGDPLIRVHFGPLVPADAYDATPHRVRGYLSVAQDLMRRIAELGEQDRAIYAAAGAGTAAAATAAASGDGAGLRRPSRTLP
jgi:1-acyl-sn-glycerol-3-phosphate acyltransferase